MFISTTVISEPNDVTACEGLGRSTTLSCVLDSSIDDDDVQWYRFIKDTGKTKRVDEDDILYVPISTETELDAQLYITNARKSYTGYYWVRTPSSDVCNVSFTVTTSMYAYIECISLCTACIKHKLRTYCMHVQCKILTGLVNFYSTIMLS